MDIRVTGAEELAAAGRRLKAAGESGKGLRKNLLKSIRESAKPAVEAVKENTSILPQRGGLAARIRTGIGVRTTTSGKNVGVRIVARNSIQVEGLNAGKLRHPVFGNREVWVGQSVKPGWFTDPLEKREAQFRADILNAMRATAREIEG